MFYLMRIKGFVEIVWLKEFKTLMPWDVNLISMIESDPLLST